jgi:hypothetical protein
MTLGWYGFVLTACIWGITNPFIKRGSIVLNENRNRRSMKLENGSNWMQNFIFEWILLIQTPSYTIPWIINLMGSILYYITLNQAGKM